MSPVPEFLPPPPTRAPDVVDDFAGPTLRRDLWVDHYLPHWTSPERSVARYDLDDAGLRLRIDENQPYWRDEDAPLRVSNLQTGTFSGARGTATGTHRHREHGLTVRTPTPTRLLWAPSAGRIDLTVTASGDDGCMLAAWLVGTEHLSPEHAGEVCVFEIDASAIGADRTTARCGVKAHGDPALVNDMAEVVLPFDATRPHTWTAIWGEGGTVIGCEGRVLRKVPHAPRYPLFLMIDLFEVAPRSAAEAYPKTARVHAVRAWSGR